MHIKSFTQKDRYGNMTSVEFFEDPGIPSITVIPEYDHPGDPKGTDTVPAWLTPGENVVNAEASRLPGNQEIIDKMNEDGREIQQAQGGPIPTYANEGKFIAAPKPDWLTEDLIYALMLAESSGNADAKNPSSTATGLAQILINTAADPGYKTQPLSPEDRKDPVKAKRFVEQYLSGIQEAYPKFTPEQVITAYHAGPTGMKKYLDGKGKLREESQNYYNRVLGHQKGLSSLRENSGMIPTLTKTGIGYKSIDPSPEEEIAKGNLIPVEEYLGIPKEQAPPPVTPERVQQEKGMTTFMQSLLPSLKVPMYKATGTVSTDDEFAREREEQKRIAQMITASGANVVMPEGDANILNPEEQQEQIQNINTANIAKLFPELDEEDAQASLVIPPQKPALSTFQSADGQTRPVTETPLSQIPSLGLGYDELMAEKRIEQKQERRADALAIAQANQPKTPLSQIPSLGLGDYNPTIAEGKQFDSDVIIPAPTKEQLNKLNLDIEIPKEETPELSPIDQVISDYESMRSRGLSSGKAPLNDPAFLKPWNDLTLEEKEKYLNFVSPDKLGISPLRRSVSIPTAENTTSEDEANKISESVGQVDLSNKGELTPSTKLGTFQSDDGQTRPENTPQQKEALTTIADRADKITPEGEASIQALLNSLKPSEKDKVNKIASNVGGWFKDAFSDLFSGPELARMALLYAGSRVAGYDHNSSLGYSAKQYLKRVDAQNAQFQKDIRDEDYQDFTEASRKEFEKTKDYSVLRKKPEAPAGISGTSGTKYDTYKGTIVQVYTVGEGANKRLVVNDNGTLIPATSSRFEVVQPETHNLAKVTDRFNTALQAKADEINKTRTKEKEPLIDFATQELAQESANFYNATRQLFRMNVNTSQRLRSEILGAQADYLEAMAKGENPSSIEGFYNKRIISLKTGKAISFNDIKNTDAEKFSQVDQSIMTLARNQAVDENKDAGKLYREFWEKAKSDWNKIEDKKSYSKASYTDGYDPFVMWVRDVILEVPEAVALSPDEN